MTEDIPIKHLVDLKNNFSVSVQFGHQCLELQMLDRHVRLPSTKIMLMSEDKKVRKPLMEKKRRERINKSLDILKDILITCDPQTVNKMGTKTVKLEKADILELTVDFVRAILPSRRPFIFSQVPHPQRHVVPPPYQNCPARDPGVLAPFRPKPLLSCSPDLNCNELFYHNSNVNRIGTNQTPRTISKLDDHSEVSSNKSSYVSDEEQFVGNNNESDGEILEDGHPDQENIWRPW